MTSLCRRFYNNHNAAAAVEFAFVALFVILSIAVVLTAGVIAYFRLSLDFATHKAARQVMIGAAAKTSMTQSQLITSQICPYLPYGMDCTKIILNLYSVGEASAPAGYYQFVNSSATILNIPVLNNAQSNYNVGGDNTYEYLQVIYPFTEMPSGVAKVLGGSTYNGSPAFLIVSTAAFKNEQY